MASKAFIDALNRKKNAAELMKGIKDAKREYSKPNIPDGEYILSVAAEAGVTPNKGIPFVKFLWRIVDDSEAQGRGSQWTIYLEDADKDREKKSWNQLGVAFKKLLDTKEVNVENANDIAALIEAVNEQKIYCRSRVVNWEKGFNVFFNEVVEEEVSA